MSKKNEPSVIDQVQDTLVSAGLIDAESIEGERGTWGTRTAGAWAKGMRRAFPEAGHAHMARLVAQPQRLRDDHRDALLALNPDHEPDADEADEDEVETDAQQDSEQSESEQESEDTGDDDESDDDESGDDESDDDESTADDSDTGSDDDDFEPAEADVQALVDGNDKKQLVARAAPLIEAGTVGANDSKPVLARAILIADHKAGK